MMLSRAQPPIRILVDDRERESHVVAALASMEGVEPCVKRLSVGDYVVDNLLVVERKTHPDFVQSIRDGRLFRQAWRLASSPAPRCCIVIEGPTEGPFNLPRVAIQGALITVSVRFGVPVLRSLGPEDTARLLVIAGRQHRRSDLGPPRARPVAYRSARSTQELMLLTIRGIGPAKANALLDRFGSLRTLATTPVEDLSIVPGIGEKSARSIRWALNGVRTTRRP